MEREDGFREADNRMKRFFQFIRKYAATHARKEDEEGAKEIEYYINKIKTDAAQRDEETFKKMEDGVKVAEKIFKSRKINDCKMQEMKVRFDMIERVQEEARKKLKSQSEDPKQYRQLLKKLILQGLIKLVEEKVEIRCLRSDEKLISQIIGECQKEFNEICSVQTSIVINKSNYLVPEDLGGVTLTSLTGRIVCDNTLRARLSYCVQLFLPSIRSMLFQESDHYLSQRRQEKKQREQQAKAKAAA